MDDLATKRSWRDRQAREVVRSEHTREIHETLPLEFRALLLELADVSTRQGLVIAELQADLARARTDIEQLRSVLASYLKGAAA